MPFCNVNYSISLQMAVRITHILDNSKTTPALPIITQNKVN